MKIKDTFAYSARWDSVGLDCSTCIHFSGPENWPDTENTSKCTKHKKSLAIELAKNGFKEWEWFCKSYEDNGGFPEAVKHFFSIQQELEPNILYRLYGEEGFLLEFKIAELKKAI